MFVDRRSARNAVGLTNAEKRKLLEELKGLPMIQTPVGCNFPTESHNPQMFIFTDEESRLGFVEVRRNKANYWHSQSRVLIDTLLSADIDVHVSAAAIRLLSVHPILSQVLRNINAEGRKVAA